MTQFDGDVKDMMTNALPRDCCKWLVFYCFRIRFIDHDKVVWPGQCFIKGQKGTAAPKFSWRAFFFHLQLNKAFRWGLAEANTRSVTNIVRNSGKLFFLLLPFFQCGFCPSSFCQQQQGLLATRRKFSVYLYLYCLLVSLIRHCLKFLCTPSWSTSLFEGPAWPCQINIPQIG